MDFELQSHVNDSNHIDNPIIPLFLLKTYSILDSSDPTIVAWSNEGDSFTVKDIERFSEEVIPAHFKHNKFSSFVRQLNFYGFRKVKGKLTLMGTTTCSWEFRHPYFLRGHPDLLTEIKRSSSRGNHAKEDHHAGHDTSENETIENLKAQVDHLTQIVEDMNKSAEQMRAVIAQYQSMGLPADDETIAADWDMGDEDMLVTFLDDMKVPTPDVPPLGGLKRCRSVDEFLSVLDDSKRPKTISCDFSDPAVVQDVANAIALNMESPGKGPAVSFEQYVSALGAILSCAGMSASTPAAEFQNSSNQKMEIAIELRQAAFLQSL